MGGQGDDVLAAADRNMRRAWESLLRGAPAPGKVDEGGLLLLSSGLDLPLFNPAFVTGAAGDPAGVVERVVGHYRSLGAPFALYFRDETAPGLADACAAAGLVEHWRPALMVLRPIPPTFPDPPPGLGIARVDEANLERYASALAAAFGLSPDLVGQLFGPSLLGLDGFVGLLGTVGDEPVAASGVFVSDGVAGIYNVATVPAQRGRGIGAAVTWAAVRAGADTGTSCSVLQASEQGEPVYRRMGYATPTRYRQFERAQAHS